MQTKDHALLGRFLLEQHNAALTPLCRRLFLLGCVEPDWNPFSYVRGSLRYQAFHGHNAENAEQHLSRLIAQLQESGARTPLQWFRFGAALHYLADSYTFAHNRMFAGNLWEHWCYERLLHPVFVAALQTPPTELLPADGGSHRRYLTEQRAYGTDCRYILGTAMGLSKRLAVQWRTDGGLAPKKLQKVYGKV